MAGKAPVFVSGNVRHALEYLSKNTLIDILADRARAELGEDTPDEGLVELIQGWIDPVLAARNDRPLSLAGLIAKKEKNDHDYIHRIGKFRQVAPCPICGVRGDMRCPGQHEGEGH